MWDSLVLEETTSNEQEWGLRHDAVVAEEHTKDVLQLWFHVSTGCVGAYLN